MSGACTSSSPSADGRDQPPSTNPPPTEPAERSANADRPVKVGVVGVCGSGKSTLVAALKARGLAARQIDQEHSYVPDLWRRFDLPDVLVYLDAGDATVAGRIGPLLYSGLLPAQRERLAHARAHAHVYVQTDDKNPGEVLDTVLAAIDRLAVRAARPEG
jgi:hypothetical protein